MTGQIVNARSPLDSVRIECLGDYRAVTIPAELIRAIDDVFRAAIAIEEGLDLYDVECDDSGETFWQACLGNYMASGPTPWAAIKALADEVQWDGHEVRGRL